MALDFIRTPVTELAPGNELSLRFSHVFEIRSKSRKSGKRKLCRNRAAMLDARSGKGLSNDYVLVVYSDRKTILRVDSVVTGNRWPDTSIGVTRIGARFVCLQARHESVLGQGCSVYNPIQITVTWIPGP